MLLRNGADRMVHHRHHPAYSGHPHGMDQERKQGRTKKNTRDYLDNLLLDKPKKAKEITVRTSNMAACKECKLYTKYIFNML